MIVHDSFSVSCFPRKSAGSFKMAATSSASEIRVYIQDDNHDKENIEDQGNIEKMFSEESGNSQELEETPNVQRLRVRRAMRRDGVRAGPGFGLELATRACWI